MGKTTFFSALTIRKEALFSKKNGRSDKGMNENSTVDRLLSSRDVADRLQINIRTAQKIIRSIPHINISTGRKKELLRITEEMLESYINERTVMYGSVKLNRNRPPVRRQVSVSGTDRIPRRPPD